MLLINSILDILTNIFIFIIAFGAAKAVVGNASSVEIVAAFEHYDLLLVPPCHKRHVAVITLKFLCNSTKHLNV